MQPLPQPSLFLSDVHLGGFSDKKNRQLEHDLIKLIDFCQEHEIKIYILGDLFDFWMEYPGHVPSLGRKVNERFKEYNDALGPTLYITGNHDNWTRSYLPGIGFRIEPNYQSLATDEQKLLLLHGDGLLTENDGLRRPPMHQLLRNETFIKVYQTLLPPAAGLWVMKWFSRLNRFFGSFKEDITLLNSWAEKTLNEGDFDIIICGHDHFPRKKEFDFGTFLNLGTFYKHRTMAFYNNNDINIVVWDSGSRQLNNFYTSENKYG
ncbi:metallophosphoesterase [Aliifodinibius sp. S!AR15-10]|uniref:UDP-2,3-diacylglucosamine diphosphatase n=1 Tax=Aliifodinibius sp. S!AR15-10 TaxID=2950437 RepID=UPI00285A64A4|nr:metallophosphoesterase [Aliifodinibius sp. S!AR15-10]MDR8390208.1 metallophosphoesterase [Aliifodinibius sp. S!AR15-10]